MAFGSRTSKKPVVLVTGSRSLLGTAVCRELAPAYSVFGLDIAAGRAEQDDAIRPIECDITSPDDIRRGLRIVMRDGGGDLASVIHAAGWADDGIAAPGQQFYGAETRSVLSALQCFNVEQFVLISSVEAMCGPGGAADGGQALTDGQWDNAQAMLAREQAALEDRQDTPLVILRLSTVYDDDCRAPQLARQIKRINEHSFESHFYPGDSNLGQPFVHIDDAVDCIAQAVKRRADLEPVETFLVAEEDLLSCGALQDRIGELIHGQEWRAAAVRKLVAKTGAWVLNNLGAEDGQTRPYMIDLADEQYPVEASKARLRLGWQPHNTLWETLVSIVERLRADPRGWYGVNDLGEAPTGKLGTVVVDDREAFDRARKQG